MEGGERVGGAARKGAEKSQSKPKKEGMLTEVESLSLLKHNKIGIIHLADNEGNVSISKFVTEKLSLEMDKLPGDNYD